MLPTVKSQKGITLLELLTCMIILAIISLGTMQMIKTGYNVQSSELRNHKTREQYHEVVRLLTKDIKESTYLSVDNYDDYDELVVEKNNDYISYIYEKATGIFYYNNFSNPWFKADKLDSTKPNAIEYDPQNNTVHFMLSIKQQNKPPLPLDLVVSARFKDVE